MQGLKVFFWAMRPLTFARNLILLVPLIFSGSLFSGIPFLKWLASFTIFCALLGCVNMINQLRKVWKDKWFSAGHIKMNTKDQISTSRAEFIGAVIIIVAIVWAYLISTKFGSLALSYFLLHLAYYLYLQRIKIFNFLVMPLAYTMAVIGSGYIIWYYVSPLLLCAVFTFLVLVSLGQYKTTNHHEAVPYRQEFLDQMLNLLSVSGIIFYALYTFFSGQVTFQFQTPLLILTIPFAIGAVSRYFYLLYTPRGNARLPEGQTVGGQAGYETKYWSDLPLIWTLLGWGALAILIIYARL